MAMHGSMARRLKILELAVRIEGMKPTAERDLSTDALLAQAKVLDKFARTTAFSNGEDD
jgi:hypothetical protein